MPKSYLIDKGTTIEIDCGEDISAATDKKILIKMPDAAVTILTKPADFSDDGIDGKVEWIDTELEMVAKGKYYVQARIEFGSGSSVFYSETRSFTRFNEYK
jgi:hypothetical protein